MNGHICRCTGYFPIKNALNEAPIVDIEELEQLCGNCPSRKIRLELNDWKQVIKPQTLAELKSALSQNTGISIVAGNTAKHVEKYYTDKVRVNALTTIDVTKVAEFSSVTHQDNAVIFGAAISLEDMRQTFSQLKSPVFRNASSFMVKVGSTAMRNQATWAGSLSLQRNVASFPSDISVMLAAMGMRLSVIDYSTTEQELSLTLLTFIVSSKLRARTGKRCILQMTFITGCGRIVKILH